MRERPEPLPGTTAPLAIRWLTFATIALGGFVKFEPAPTDMVFSLLFLIVVTLRAVRLKGMGGTVALGVAIFMLGNFISLAVTPILGEGVRYLLITVYMVLLFAVVAGLIGRYGPRFLELCLNAYCVAVLVVGGLSLAGRFGIISAAPFTDPSGLRLQGMFKDPNVFAPFVAAGVPVSLCLYLTGRLSTFRSLVVLGVSFLCTVFAFSRGAYGVLAAALGIFGFSCMFIIRDKQISRKLTIALSLGAVVGVFGVVYAVAFTDLGEFMTQRFAMQRYDQHRFAMQAAAWHVAADHLLGVGPGAWTTIHWQDPHNVYLRILAENGLVGCVGFVLWALACVKRGAGGMLRRTPNAPFYAMGIAVVTALLLESVIIDTLHWRLLFLFMAFPVGLRIWEFAERGRPA